MKIGITCPVYINNAQHLHYLDLTTRSIISKDHDLVFIPVDRVVNPEFYPIAYRFDHEPEKIVPREQPTNCVAQAWNTGISTARELGCDYVLVINTDIVFKSNAIDRLVTFAEAHPEAVMWTMSEYSDLAMLEECPEDEGFNEHPGFSYFMVKTNFFDNVGTFDENFVPAYCEDGDMHARLALGGFKAYIYGGARVFHFGSATIKNDFELKRKNDQVTFPINQQYFLEKWGHPPVNEVDKMREVYYKTPYNIKGMSLKDFIPNFWRFLSLNNTHDIKDLSEEQVFNQLKKVTNNEKK